MRILTKKKVVVPASATSQHNRIPFNQGQDSQGSIDQSRV